MKWYWWVLIATGVMALGALKLFVFGKLKSREKKKITHDDED